ncbi:MAG: NTP transferase domain-containing protein [Gammaproteobacteria bacterium]|nr:NTP transferase domain-containing protein [Gammaproteobacteria bacterium]
MKNKKVVAIVQARMQSTRLPGKVLLPLNNKPALQWIVERIRLAKLVDEVVVAIPYSEADFPIYSFCKLKGFHCFSYKGKEDDVIGRVLTAAEWAEANIIVDITGDCPMVDPRHIDCLIKNLIDFENLDYVSNDIVKRSWPDGLDIQVYWTTTLKKCKEKYNPNQHCGYNIPTSSGFDYYNWPAPQEFHWPELGLTLDTPKDYKMLSKLFDKFGHDPGFKVEDVIKFLRANPDWITNTNVRRKKPEEG